MKTDSNLIFGTRPVLEALEAKKTLQKILINKNYQSETAKQVERLAKSMEIPVQKVPVEKLNRTVKANHQGIIAFASPVEFLPIEEVVANLFEKGIDPWVLVLDELTDTRNLGAIIRSAECFGVHAILMGTKNNAMITPETVKTSAGAVFNIAICRSHFVVGTMKLLKHSGLKVIGISEKGSDQAIGSTLRGPIAMVMGAEDTGISPQMMKLVDESIAIPMSGKTASLNVSVAAGIMLFRAYEQRQNPAKSV